MKQSSYESRPAWAANGPCGGAHPIEPPTVFDEALNTKVFTQAPYAAHTGRDTLNSNDSIYKDVMLMKVAADGDGYLGAHVLSGLCILRSRSTWRSCTSIARVKKSSSSFRSSML